MPLLLRLFQTLLLQLPLLLLGREHLAGLFLMLFLRLTFRLLVLLWLMILLLWLSRGRVRFRLLGPHRDEAAIREWSFELELLHPGFGLVGFERRPPAGRKLCPEVPLVLDLDPKT